MSETLCNNTVTKLIMWKDTKEVFTALFGIEPMVDDYEEDIFFWVKDEQEFEQMKDPSNGNYDFVLVD